MAYVGEQFCKYCGAGKGPYRRDGEGTCFICDPPHTHYDPVETGAICHTECAIQEIKRLREVEKNSKLCCGNFREPIEHIQP
jgi:hypothetical protein